MADSAGRNSSNSDEIDFDNEFQFNPSEWTVLDDDDENINGDNNGEDKKDVENSVQGKDGCKADKGNENSDSKLQSKPAGPSTRSRSSNVREVERERSNKTQPSQIRKSPATVRGRKQAGKTEAPSQPSKKTPKPQEIGTEPDNPDLVKAPSSSQKDKKGNSSLADAFVIAESKHRNLSSTKNVQPSNVKKRKTQDASKTTPTKVMRLSKDISSAGSPLPESSPKIGSVPREVDKESSLLKSSSSGTPALKDVSKGGLLTKLSPTSVPRQSKEQVKAHGQGSTSVENLSNQKSKSPAARSSQSKESAEEKSKTHTHKDGDTDPGGSIADIMGVKVTENSGLEIVDEDEKNNMVKSSSSLDKAGGKMLGEKTTTNKSKSEVKGAATSGTSVSIVQSLGTTGKEGNTAKNSEANSAHAGVKKRIVRRFHRTTQTSSPQSLNKLVQCLIRIPSLDCPRKSTNHISQQTEDDNVPPQVDNITVNPDTVSQEVLNEAIAFGTDYNVARNKREGFAKNGIRICKIQQFDVEKAYLIIRKANGHSISFKSQDMGMLDLFFEDEDNIVYVLNQLRKFRGSQRHICMSLVIPNENADKNDGPANLKATIVFDQNHASVVLIAHSRAPAWNRPKTEVYVSVHNVPKGVPLSFFHLIFPDAISIELDNPDLKVTKEDRSRIRLGMTRKSVEQFLNLFTQVVVNDTPLFLTSGVTGEEDVPEMKKFILESENVMSEKEKTLVGVARNINLKIKPKEKDEPEIIMQVDDVKSIDAVLTGQANTRAGPTTPDKLKQLKNSSPRGKTTVPEMNKDELSDISDDSDVGDEDLPSRVIKNEHGAFGNPDELNKWRQTEPLSMLKMGPGSFDRHPSKFVGKEPKFRSHQGLDERIVESPPRIVSSRERGFPQGSRDKPGDKKWMDLNDADFDKRHKVIVPQKSMAGSDEGDLRSMLDDLKSRRSSRADDPLSISPVGRRSVEFSRRSPGRDGLRRRGSSRSPDRPDRDRRIVQKSVARVRRGESPPPFRPGQRSRERPNLRNSLSPARRRKSPSPLRPKQRWSRERQNLRKSVSPTRRRRSPSPRFRKRSRERQNLRKSLSPILPFRPNPRGQNVPPPKKFKGSSPGRHIGKGLEGNRNPPNVIVIDDMDDSPRKDQKKSSMAGERRKSALNISDPDINMTKTLYNTLMDRLKEKADVYQQSKDSNLMDAANVYSQINELAEQLTAIKKEEQVGKWKGTNPKPSGLPDNKQGPITAASNLHPDLLCYVKAGSSSSSHAPIPPPILPPPIPPPVAPPMFSNISQEEKASHLEAIAKQLATNILSQPQDTLSGGDGVSGGTWMAPPKDHIKNFAAMSSTSASSISSTVSSSHPVMFFPSGPNIMNSGPPLLPPIQPGASPFSVPPPGLVPNPPGPIFQPNQMPPMTRGNWNRPPHFP